MVSVASPSSRGTLQTVWTGLFNPDFSDTAQVKCDPAVGKEREQSFVSEHRAQARGAEERREEEGVYGSTIETPQQRVGWKAVRDDSKKDNGKAGCGILIGQRSMDHYFATAAEAAGARVLTEVLDLISTEQMTELTAFKGTDRIVRDARTQINEIWSTFRVQWCGLFSSEHTLEALVGKSDFWEDRFSRPKSTEKFQSQSTTLLRVNGKNRRGWLVKRLERKGSTVERR